MKDFDQRTVVVTGAGSGFGREFARIAHSLNMNLVLADIQETALQETVLELEAKRTTAKIIAQRCDVSKAKDVESLANAAVQAFGGIDLAFNNAGVGAGGLVWENSLKDWEWVMGVNVMGVVHGVHYFTPIMLRSGREGHIVNTASMAGILNAQLMGIYNVSKHAVVSLTETLFQDLRITNSKIGCSVLCPAFVPTGIHLAERNRPTDLSNEQPPTQSQQLAQSQSVKAVTSGKVTVEQVGAMVFDAIRENRFYIFTHPKIMGSVSLRFEDVLQARNPSDPFTYKPQAGKPSTNV